MIHEFFMFREIDIIEYFLNVASEDGSGGYVTNLFNVSELDASYDFDEIYQVTK